MLKNMGARHIVRAGTEVKINIHLEPIGELTMDNYAWTAEIYTMPSSKVVKVSKGEAIRVDEANYIVAVDTSETGTGELKVRIKAEIPDGDFGDGLRREIVVLDTDITVAR